MHFLTRINFFYLKNCECQDIFGDCHFVLHLLQRNHSCRLQGRQQIASSTVTWLCEYCIKTDLKKKTPKHQFRDVEIVCKINSKRCKMINVTGRKKDIVLLLHNPYFLQNIAGHYVLGPLAAHVSFTYLTCEGSAQVGQLTKEYKGTWS